MSDGSCIDTVGDLRRLLEDLPDALPITAHYAGDGRVVGYPSFVDGGPACFVLHEAKSSWLRGAGYALDNPAYVGGPVTNPSAPYATHGATHSEGIA